jgi:single stranded DNA-binding protein
MASYQKIVVVGKVKGDPESQFTPAGTQLTKFSVLVTEKYGKDAEPKFIYFNCTAWAKLAELISDMVKDGQQILVELKYAPSVYEKDGKNVTFPQFKVDNFTLLGTKPASTTGAATEQDFDGNIPF